MPSREGAEVGTLAGLVEELATAVERPDEAFTRYLAAALHERAAHLSLPEVDALGLEDVMITFYMDREIRLVVTGHLVASGGEGSMRWHERDFPRVPVVVHQAPRADPYLFATLDFSVRAQRGRLLTPAPPLPAGLEVTLRCLSTVGDEVTYRIVGAGQEVSVAPDALRLLDGDET
ncbi:MAG: hypothetical protein QF464_19030 [Myxococcota bacterium]|jgi:hypothetical protein|nr:hypothetical protein [Myxococcota bacterium]